MNAYKNEQIARKVDWYLISLDFNEIKMLERLFNNLDTRNKTVEFLSLRKKILEACSDAQKEYYERAFKEITCG